MPTIIGFWKRRPGMDLDTFRECWSQFGDLAGATPGLQRYVQSLTLPGAYREGEPFADGVAELTHDDLASVAGTPEAVAGRTFAETFLDFEHRVQFMADEVVIKDGPVPADGVKAFVLAVPRDGMDEAEFHHYWTHVHGPIAASLPGMHRYVQAHSHTMVPGPDGRIVAGCAVTWYDSVDAMRAQVQSPEWAAVVADEANFVQSDPPLLITREHVIFGEP